MSSLRYDQSERLRRMCHLKQPLAKTVRRHWASVPSVIGRSGTGEGQEVVPVGCSPSEKRGRKPCSIG